MSKDNSFVAKSFCITKTITKKPFLLEIKFCGKYAGVGNYDTEKSRVVGAFAVEHKPRFESSQNFHDFRFFVKTWTVAQGYLKQLAFEPNSFPLELQSVVEALVELQKTIKQERRKERILSKSSNLIWTNEEIEILKRTYPSQTSKEISEKINRNPGSIYKKAQDLNLQKQKTNAR